jgi:hypothetical protein
MNWRLHPNLAKRPASPNKGRGRVQKCILRAFLIGGQELTTSQILDWTHRPRRGGGPLPTLWLYGGLHRVLRQIADPIRKVPPHNAWLWRLKPDKSE